MPEPTGNEAFDRARAGGVIDTFLSMPDTRARQAAKYQNIRDLSHDRETKSMEMPAEYMFKGVPHYEDDEVDDPIQVVLAGMETHGITKFLVGVHENEHSKRAVREHPDRFAGMLNVDPNSGMEAVRSIDAAIEEWGASLRAVHCWGTGLNPQVPVGDKMMYPIYAKCVEVGLPIIVYAGVPGPRIPAMAQHPMQLDEVCWFFPELQIVSRHGAEPWTELMVKLLLKWPGLHYSTSAFAPKYYPRDIIEFANSPGRRQGHLRRVLRGRPLTRPDVRGAALGRLPRPRLAEVPPRERAAGLRPLARQEVLAEAVEVHTGFDRRAARRTEGTGGDADRDDRHRLDPVGELDDAPDIVRGVGGERGEGGAVAERPRGEQQVLHGGEDRRGEGGPPAAARVAGHHHDDGGGTEAGLDRLVDLREERGFESPCGRVVPAVTPESAPELVERGAAIRVAHDDELPGLRVLRARCPGGGLEDPSQVRVGHEVGGVRTVRTLRAGHREEPGRFAQGSTRSDRYSGCSVSHAAARCIDASFFLLMNR